ncbi:hypothetical protein [Bradyrhizobium sp. BTAi1]|uniref:hypothetical protein n=1 Tax=Bradyrhizobium sp. (strain BTAi1 / ATCC BAA-1182) TaxID=288000 RepID=UPI0002FCD86C|nr:hypothetical protein [Bradyrhizobium sp. BTAi1]
MTTTQTLIVRDSNEKIIDTIEIEPGAEITSADRRTILNTRKDAATIEIVGSIERRPS